MTAMIPDKTFLNRSPVRAEVGNVSGLMALDCSSQMTGAVANTTCGSIVDLSG
jgi:hypothetical protein